MKAIIIFLTLFLCMGCGDDREEMDKRFNGSSLLMTDQYGKRYVVSHHFSQGYSITPISDNCESQGDENIK